LFYDFFFEISVVFPFKLMSHHRRYKKYGRLLRLYKKSKLTTETSSIFIFSLRTEPSRFFFKYGFSREHACTAVREIFGIFVGIRIKKQPFVFRANVQGLR